jgi:hypothetical protein
MTVKEVRMGRGKADFGLMKELNVDTRGDLPKYCGDMKIDMEDAMGVKAFETSGGRKHDRVPTRDFESGGKNKFEDGDMEVKAVDWKTLTVGTGIGAGAGLLTGDAANRIQEARIERKEKEKQQAAKSAGKNWNYTKN